MKFIDLQAEYEYFKKDIDKIISEVLNSGQYLFGKQLEQLEINFPKLFGKKIGDTLYSFNLFPTGKAKATTFPGFCDEHDKIFEPIDAHPYEVGNLLQEFLFAMRAVAREYTVRKAMQDSLEE